MKMPVQRTPVRRLRFSIVVLISQLLLTALALAWAVHMTLIAANGAVYFVEGNQTVLWLEIGTTLAISLFGVVVFAMQLRRLGERRSGDRPSGGRQGEHSQTSTEPMDRRP